MILSESEKNRIKGLYGLVKEGETVPPDESISIANKNPFKYGEFENARRFYSSNLKNGERFYETIPFEYRTNYFSESMMKDLDEYYTTNLFEKIAETLDGKTVRIPHKDIISTLSVNYDHEGGPFVFDKPRFIPLINNLSGNVDLDSFSFEIRLSNISGGFYVNYKKDKGIEIKFAMRTDKKGSGSDSDYVLKQIEEYVIKVVNDILNNIEPYKMSNFDDKNFEIKEVKRNQTDF